MAGGDEHRRKAAIEDWLASKLAGLSDSDDEDSDDPSSEELPPDDDQETLVDPTAVADDTPPPSENTVPWPEFRAPELPSPIARVATPPPVDRVRTPPPVERERTPPPVERERTPPLASLAPEPFSDAAIPSFELDSQVFTPPPSEPPPWEGDTDPTREPLQVDLPPPAPSDPWGGRLGSWGGDGDTAPIPSFDDEPSEPELSDPGPLAGLDLGFGEPELEDLEPDQGGYDEVFPMARAEPAPLRHQREDTNTNVLLQMTDTGFAPTEAAAAPPDPEPSDASEPRTSWYAGTPAPEPRSIHEEKTEIRGFAPGQSTYDPVDDLDDDPTVIVPPPPRPAVPTDPATSGTPRPAPPVAAPYADDASHATVLAWTATSFGVLLFGSLVVIALLIVARYVQIQS